MAGFCKLAVSLLAPTFGILRRKEPIVSAVHLKNSRFWETAAGDRVRSALRGLSNDRILSANPFRAASRLGHPVLVGRNERQIPAILMGFSNGRMRLAGANGLNVCPFAGLTDVLGKSPQGRFKILAIEASLIDEVEEEPSFARLAHPVSEKLRASDHPKPVPCPGRGLRSGERTLVCFQLVVLRIDGGILRSCRYRPRQAR